ncbi:MAG TPA: hypothetical protein VFC71_03210 [Candidatus Polarisedimenticolia bacterium]|nr:hypothetical protein [Candidatus Polarisedimenticolia bacterium]
MRTFEEREQRLARARIASRIELGIAWAVFLGTLGAYVFRPYHFYEPTFGAFGPFGPIPADVVLLAVVAVEAIGLVWMLRIRYTGPVTSRTSNWRSGSLPG